MDVVTVDFSVPARGSGVMGVKFEFDSICIGTAGVVDAFVWSYILGGGALFGSTRGEGWRNTYIFLFVYIRQT